jgi:hypothetical protein
MDVFPCQTSLSVQVRAEGTAAPWRSPAKHLDSQACLVKNRGMTRNQRDGAEPTSADLAAIGAEWPLIEAELAVVDAEIRALSAAGGLSPLDWRRLRRAERRVLATRAGLYAAGAGAVTA